MKTELIPKSKAKTAYGLLSEVVAIITAEPMRLDMNDWLSHRGKHDDAWNSPPKGYPVCGTVGCIGGWVDTLKGRECGAATEILGLSDTQEHRLFMPSGLMNMQPQTLAHARATVKHIRMFQKKYRKQLLAKKV